MLIVLVFAFFAGVVTVLSPCILPVLPAILAAGASGGKARPLGVTLGLILSFAFFTLSLSAIISYTNLSADFLRYVAMAIIGIFGFIMIFPSLGEKFAQFTSGIAGIGSKIQAAGQKISSGFWSGFILGLALGLVWTPCAGPILAAVATLVATHHISLWTVLLILAYSIGTGIPMFLIAYGGNRVIASSKFLSKYSERIRKVFGVLMLFTALAIAFKWDMYYQQGVTQYFSAFTLDDTPYVKEELNKLRGTPKTGLNLSQEELKNTSTALKEGKELPILGPLPSWQGIETWLNSPPLTKEQLHGKVVLVDFWTYSCINCIRTLPYLTHWYETYKDKGLVIIGVHTPEFEFEKSLANVADAIKRFNIQYPVALDNHYKTWEAFNNSYWPAHYLADQNGKVRMVHFGEGGYAETEDAIRILLGMQPLGGKDQPRQVRQITPETYLGFQRAEHYSEEIHLKQNQIAEYQFIQPLKDDQAGLSGNWLVQAQDITSQGPNNKIILNFLATRVYLVLGGHSSEPIEVSLDGKPLSKEYYTIDMDSNGHIYVKEPRKYDIMNLHGNYGRHTLTLHIPAGVSAYAFTFGDEN